MTVKIFGFGVLLALALVLLGEAGFRGKRIAAALFAVLFLSALGEGVGKIMETVLGFAEGAKISEVATSAAKIIGVGYLFGIGADVIAELGEGMISKGLLVAGKIEILLIALPYFKDILELGLSIIK